MKYLCVDVDGVLCVCAVYLSFLMKWLKVYFIFVINFGFSNCQQKPLQCIFCLNFCWSFDCTDYCVNCALSQNRKVQNENSLI